MPKVADWVCLSFITRVYGAMVQSQLLKGKEICNIYSVTLHRGLLIAVNAKEGNVAAIHELPLHCLLFGFKTSTLCELHRLGASSQKLH